jgi:hypothetical protein
MKRDALCCATDIRAAARAAIINIIDIDGIIENPVAVA